MSPPSGVGGSAYLTALSSEIDKKLQRALSSAAQRGNLLQELFADVALEVDERSKDIIFGEEGSISAEADGYGEHAFASNIFALLFHKWIFEVELGNPVILLRYCAALVQGARNIFWIDTQTNSRRFQSLFKYLLDEVALCSERLSKIPLQAQRDLFLLLSRFMFFYNSEENLEVFLKQFPDFPNAFLVGNASDIFVTEIADQLQKLKIEPVLVHYLSRIKVLRGIELRMATSTRLKTCLYSFTSPGGPMYPTRAVRHAAWDALDFLFPVGKYPRFIISLFFRLLYPWYWPSSCWNFFVSCVKAVYYSGWEKIGRLKEL